MGAKISVLTLILLKLTLDPTRLRVQSQKSPRSEPGPSFQLTGSKCALLMLLECDTHIYVTNIYEFIVISINEHPDGEVLREAKKGCGSRIFCPGS